MPDELFFDYELPEELIAQHPEARRDDARLLVMDRSSQSISHARFRELGQFLRPNDRLVLNNTRVLPARLIGHRESTGGKWEGLVLAARPDGSWELLCQTRGYPQPGEACITNSGLRLTLLNRTDERHWIVRPEASGTLAELLEVHGQIPLPPYIRKGRAEESDRDRYQTVFAERAGSIAAPTAGLHFTPELLAQLAAAGIGTSHVTLHVGLGTFAPVKAENPRDHAIHAEWCEVTEQTAAELRDTRQRGGRIIAVGTTATRTLETAASSGEIRPYQGNTNLFIVPPYPFRAIDGLITNFHLPRTTLLLLVQAFSGSELLRRAYEVAIQERYRFFSYGDAMLVIGRAA